MHIIIANVAVIAPRRNSEVGGSGGTNPRRRGFTFSSHISPAHE